MIKIITDTTASLTREDYRNYAISPIPLYIMNDSKKFKDLFDISPDEFYSQQRKGVKYITSPIESNDFIENFKPVVETGDEIFCILLSSQISQAFANALQTRQKLNPAKITVYDSRHSGFGQAYLALKAKEMANAGANRNEIINALDNLRSRTHTYFIVESLDHLKMGGRFFWDQALIATLLHIKPIIWFDQSGKMKIHKKISTVEAVREKIIHLIEEAAKKGIEKIALHYADNQEEATEYAGQLEKTLGVPVPLVRLSPVVGTHTGPDLLGPCIITKS